MRFGVKRTGCSGFGYTVDVADAAIDGDTVFDQDGVRMLVDRKACRSSTAPRSTSSAQGLNAQFVFRNPNATGECGCGESFTVGEPVG